MDMNQAYANAAHIAGGEAYPGRWARQAAQFRTRHPPQRNAYGTAPRHWADLWRPQSAPRGLVVFVHGGYWLRFGPDDFSHLAAGALAQGWAVALPAYSLAPDARLSEMTKEIAAALICLAERVSGPIVISGHSAGGHLAARMACQGVLPEEVAVRLAKAVLISPLSDLSPLMLTDMNRDLRIDAMEAAQESPAYLARRADTAVHVWVGGAERPSFLAQAGGLAAAWACPITVEPHRHHFDVIDGLQAPSPLLRALIG
jgi:arylformamidase